MSKFNGHKNWNHWNVSLWINNDEGLYRHALDSIELADNREHAARLMFDYLTNPEFLGMTHTPDGAPYSVSAIRAAMRGL